MANKIIKVLNNLDRTSDRTFLGAAHSAGGTAVNVRNINGFYDTWALQLGDTGQETSEILLVSGTPSGTVINTSGTIRFAHPTDTPVYSIKYDKVVFKRSTSGTSGSASAMTGGTVTMTPDSSHTIFEDTTGDDTYAYKASYLNSSSTELSNDSDWLLPTGYTFYSLYNIRERIKNRIHDTNFLQKDGKTVDSLLDGWVNEWLEQMNNTAVSVNKDYLIGTTDVAHGTDGLATITATDYKELRRVWYTSDGVTFYNATKMEINDFLPGETFDTTHPYFYYQGDDVFGKKPEGQSGTARIVFYKRSPVLTNDTDEVPSSMKSFTSGFVNYALAQTYYYDQKTDMGDRFLNRADLDIDLFRSEITPRAKTGPVSIDMVESTGAFDELTFY